MATRQLRDMGFTGYISATVVFPEEAEPLRKAGVNQIYNYYDGVGGGFARVALSGLAGEQAG